MFIEELIALCEVAPAIGSFGSTIFGSSKASIPSGDGPFLVVVDSGGRDPERTQNEIVSPAWVRPSAQISARATEFAKARAMARNAWHRMHIRNQTISSLAIPISGITSGAGVATVATPSPHALATGYKILVSGAVQSAYNGEFSIVVTGLTTFSYVISGSPASPATGPIVVRQRVRYREINTLQEPFDMGSDSTGRAKVGFNVAAVKQPS